MRIERTLKSIINEISAELDDAEKIIYLRIAYSISVSAKEQAFAIGLWNKWIADSSDYIEINKIREEIKYLKDYFIKNDLDEYFSLRKKLKHGSNYWLECFFILFGLFWFFTGIFQEISGYVSVGISIKTHLPFVRNGLFAIIMASCFLVSGISSLLYNLKKKNYYKKFAHIIHAHFPKQ